MTKLGLTLNEAKTTLKNARKEHFDFLGYAFGPYHHRKDGRWYLGASPPRKVSGDSRLRSMSFWFRATMIRGPRSVTGLTQCCGGGPLLQPRNTPDGLPGRRQSRLRIGAPFPWPSNKVATRGAHRFPGSEIFGTYGVLLLRRVHLGPLPCNTPAWDSMPDDMR
jgi:RNA-directed DNA polymerase